MVNWNAEHYLYWPGIGVNLLETSFLLWLDF